MILRKKLASLLISAFLVSAAGAVTPGVKYDKIGIYDLKAIHGIDLAPEVISKKVEDGIVIEKVRFSSVNYPGKADNPGKPVRVFAILSYKEGAQKLPGLVIIERFKANPWKTTAQNNYFVISVAPPNGNQDPKLDQSVGGPKYMQPFSLDDQYVDNYNNSYIYHHTVALLRGLDYLETRPEVDLNKTVVTGYSWPGLMVTHLHALDDRPAGYVCIHGVGYHADENGNSGGSPALFSRKMYDMYGAGTYAPYGTKPIYVGVALDDYFSKLDEIQEFYNGLKSEKHFAYVPDRHHRTTSRVEYTDVPTWQQYWQGLATTKPTTIGEGTLKIDGGKAIYTAKIDGDAPLTYAEALVSYGKPGGWMGRTWHAFPLKKGANGEVTAEIPVYDPTMPMYVVGQIGTEADHAQGNGVQFFDASKLAGATPAAFPNLLFDPAAKSDLYLRTGTPTFSTVDGKSAVTLAVGGDDNGTIAFQNMQPTMWKGAKELHLWVHGDGKSSPMAAYFTYDNNYYVDKDIKSFTKIDLVPAGTAMWTGWKEVVIPMDKISNLDRVGTLFIEPGDRSLVLGQVSWK